MDSEAFIEYVSFLAPKYPRKSSPDLLTIPSANLYEYKDMRQIAAYSEEKLNEAVPTYAAFKMVFRESETELLEWIINEIFQDPRKISVDLDLDNIRLLKHFDIDEMLLLESLDEDVRLLQLQNLVKDQEIIGLEFLEKFNLNIADVENFDPKRSQVTISVRPDSDPESWKIVTKTSKSCALPGVMYIIDGHLCRSQTLVRDAATFDLKTGSVKKAFNGVLDVTLHAANTSTLHTILCSIGLTSRYHKIAENVALRIPPKLNEKENNTENTGTLQSGHLWKLAQRITNQEELLDLGLKALKLPDYMLDAARTNEADIQQAAYKILQTWSKGFESSKEAHTILLKSLKQCGMNKLAALLK